MKTVIFIFIFIYIICFSVNSLEDGMEIRERICELDTEMKIEYLNCVESTRSEEGKNAVNNYLECLGLSSPLDYLEEFCTIYAGEENDDIYERYSKCFDEKLFTKYAVGAENMSRCLEKITIGPME
ncbi:uncharacterized protein [Centruroides vittatus]|uniref:uncharacterized protein n=1 Tax=Centruroides vittatus TaxID=120091 RepID=UPI00350FEAA3